MTIAVAVRFPWGRLREMETSEVSFQEGVVFATDSRFTSSGDVLQDDGQKLYRVAGDAAMAYSGDVLAAQRAIREVRKYFSRRNPNAADEATQTVSRILRAAYDQERRLAAERKRKLEILSIVAGWRTPQGRAAVVLFEGPKFKPQQQGTGIVGGSRRDRNIFGEKLAQFEEARWADSHLSLDPRAWQIDVAGSLWAVIEDPESSRTIGGKVQTVAITADGFVQGEVSYTEGDPFSLESWTVVTTPMSAVRPYRSG